MNNKKIYIGLAALAISCNGFAQTNLCQFEEQDYKSISTHDTWAESPFNKGTLEKQFGIFDNPLKNEFNETDKVFAFQRSRYASHLYGARIDLKEPIALTPTPQYIHVLVNKPVKGNMALVGLGKRKDRANQSAETVQFVVNSTKEIGADNWEDAVFSIFGNEMAELHSIVIVPDPTSHIASDEDFTVYIDEIMLSDSSQPRFSTDAYPLSFEKDLEKTRTDRDIESIEFTGNKGLNFSTNLQGTRTVYTSFEKFDIIPMMPGEEINTKIGYNGEWMHRYVYFDKGNDGKFQPVIENNVPTAESDLVAYSYLNGYDSKGAVAEKSTRNNPPAFIIPENQEPGFYRIRCKVDWDSSDAGGNADPSNLIANNGGFIIDFVANVHNENVKVNFVSRMCDITSVDGGAAPAETKFGEDFSFNVKMDSDYEITGLEIKHGYNHDGQEYKYDQRQWKVENIELEKDGLITIPAEYIDGDVSITILFKNKPGTDIAEVENEGLTVIPSKGEVELSCNTETEYTIVGINGMVFDNGTLTGSKTVKLPAGFYIINNNKYVVE